MGISQALNPPPKLIHLTRSVTDQTRMGLNDVVLWDTVALNTAPDVFSFDVTTGEITFLQPGTYKQRWTMAARSQSSGVPATVRWSFRIRQPPSLVFNEFNINTSTPFNTTANEAESRVVESQFRVSAAGWIGRVVVGAVTAGPFNLLTSGHSGITFEKVGPFF